jgi:hypothetical protein
MAHVDCTDFVTEIAAPAETVFATMISILHEDVCLRLAGSIDG